MTVQPDGELCECGKRGCLQTYASESWLIRKARLLYQSTPSTYLHQLVKNENEITLQTILNAYELGDDIIVKLISAAIQSIAIAITNLNMIIDSDRVFIHGELFESQQATALLKSRLDFEPNLFTLPFQPADDRQIIFTLYRSYRCIRFFAFTVLFFSRIKKCRKLISNFRHFPIPL